LRSIPHAKAEPAQLGGRGRIGEFGLHVGGDGAPRPQLDPIGAAAAVAAELDGGEAFQGCGVAGEAELVAELMEHGLRLPAEGLVVDPVEIVVGIEERLVTSAVLQQRGRLQAGCASRLPPDPASCRVDGGG